MSTSYAYEKYFGLEEHPFSITPDPRFVYLSDSHRAALEQLEYGAEGGVNGFVLLTGDVGTGKTTICRTFLQQLPPKTEVALILNPVLTLNEFLQTICDELNLAIEGNPESNKNLIDQLNRFLLQVYAIGQKTILIIDEAQSLTQELLEQLRLLTNLETNTDKLLQIFLIGQPELQEMLKRPEMLQVAQRITSRYHLGPLNKTETREYILRRLEVAGSGDVDFATSGIREVYAFSKGVPRLINVLCDKALLSAYERSTHKIDAKVIRDAKRRVLGNIDSAGRGSFPKAASVLAAVILLMAVLLGAGYWMNAANLRPWVDARLAEFQSVEDTSPPPVAQAPQTAEPEVRIPAPAADTLDPPELSEAAGGAPIEATAPLDEARSSAEEQDIGVLEEAVSEAVAVEPAEPPAPVEPSSTPTPEQPAGMMESGIATGTAEIEPVATDRVPAAPAQSTPAAPVAPVVAPIANVAPAHGGGNVSPPPPDARSLPAAPQDQSLADYTRRHAERKLLSMWGITTARPVGLDFCQSVSRHDLNCLKEASGLSGLHLYDRPAILYLKIGKVATYAVVLSASPESVVLDVLDREHVIPANALRDVWDGSFLLLWRKPGNIQGHLVQGATGPSTVWLRRAIDQIEGKNTSGNVYDMQLVERVKKFQRKVSLTVDGIVGPRTLILLQNKLAKTGN